MSEIKIVNGTPVVTPLVDGLLQMSGGGPITATLNNIADQVGNTTPLEISTLDVTNNGGSSIASNTAFGQGALTSNTTGTDSTAFGQFALDNQTTATSNSAFGDECFLWNRAARENVL